MIRLYYSSSPDLAKRAARRDIKKDFPNLDDSNFVSFNMKVSPLKDLAEECSFLSLGSERKCVLAYDCFFLAKSKAKAKFGKEDNPAALLEYLSNPIYETDLYLLVYSPELDDKSEMVAAIKKNGFIKEVLIPSTDDWVAYAIKYLGGRGISIERKAAAEVVRRVNQDFGVFTNELDKLIAYSGGEPISYQAVTKIVTKLEEDDAFAIGNAIIKGKNEDAIEAYRKAKRNGAEEVRLINMVASQLLYLDQVSFLDSIGYNANMIARELGGSPKRAEIARSNLYGLKQGKLERLLEDLYQTQKKILSGEIAPELGFSLFLARA